MEADAARSQEEKDAVVAEEQREKVKRIAEARAAIEASRGPALSAEAREQLGGLRDDLEEIDEIDAAIRNTIESNALNPEERQHETGRLEALAKEREAINRKIRAIKSGAPDALSIMIDRRVGIGRETKPVQPKKAWWMRLLGR